LDIATKVPPPAYPAHHLLSVVLPPAIAFPLSLFNPLTSALPGTFSIMEYQRGKGLQRDSEILLFSYHTSCLAACASVQRNFNNSVKKLHFANEILWKISV
jgi:hypothetical protein